MPVLKDSLRIFNEASDGARPVAEFADHPVLVAKIY